MFDPALPISARVKDIAIAIDAHPVVIVAGETGSGKTTQLPKICLAMGRGLKQQIGVTEPRRIAATSVAARVAEEIGCELGNEVGYQIRFANRTSRGTYVKFMTDGILLAETQADRDLVRYDTIILDEAHERSLNIDFLLGYVAGLRHRRPDLRIIISSATLEVDRFAAFFDGAPVIEVSGRTHPVETIYRPPTDTEEDIYETLGNVVEEITSLDPRGDILVFLPGEREIRDAQRALTDHALPRTELLPLYGRLSQAEQKQVFVTGSQRRIVLATNVAETSLTIPGIVYVIDCGVARLNRYQARSGVTQLLVEPISQASANQRKGRAGRIESGVCFRLYEEADFSLRPAFTDPEVLRVGLAGAILQMKSLGIGDLREFPFIDPPPKRAVDEGYRVLEELGALASRGELSDLGRKLARLPLDPRISRMVLAANEENALAEVLVIAAALGVADPRERPQSDVQRADQAHRCFRNDRSDFLGLLMLWQTFHDQTRGRSKGQVKAYCRTNYLSAVRMKEWADIHEQLRSVVSEMKFVVNTRPASEEAILRSILPGLLSRIGMWHPENRCYLGARQTRFVLHPSSALAKRPPPWVVVAELVETSQLFGRMAAAIDPKTLPLIAGSLCKRSHGDPSYSEKTGEVMAAEEVTLFGLPIVRGERVRIAPYHPAAARRVFIMDGLVRELYEPKHLPPFLRENGRVLETVRELRARARRSEMMIDEDALFAFFDARVPEEVVSASTFEKARTQVEASEPRRFFLTEEDVLLGDAETITEPRYPSSLSLGSARLTLTYRFDPSRSDDGITCDIPIAVLPQLDPTILEWTIPGWHRDKIGELLHGLPKSTQRTLGSIDDLAGALAATLEPFDGPMLSSLAQAVRKTTGERLHDDAFDVLAIPSYLRFTFRVIGEDKKLLGESKDLTDLQRQFAGEAKKSFATLRAEIPRREELRAFPAEGLPTTVQVKRGGLAMEAYPALVDDGAVVSVELFASRAEAEQAGRGGLRKLLLLSLGKTEDALAKNIPGALAAVCLSSERPVNVRRVLVQRALDELVAGVTPRTRPEFDVLVRRVSDGLGASLSTLSALALRIAEASDQVWRLLASRAGKPGYAKESLDGVRLQLEAMDLETRLRVEGASRLRLIARYLQGILVRLERLPNGPQKDRDKAALVQPFFRAFMDRREGLAKRGIPQEDLEAFFWLIEEYRLLVFAPELGPSLPISDKRLKERWTLLERGG